MTNDFKETQRNRQMAWRKTNISTMKYGFHNGERYAHVVPRLNWKENLWAGIREELPEYISARNIQAHTGTNNLLSSWVNCANLYFPVRIIPDFRRLMIDFLKTKLKTDVISINAVELEFAFEGDLSPSALLGEAGGRRGSSQTSPDVALLVTTKNGPGIVLIESKYTEHSFYACSARRSKGSAKRPANPDISRCMRPAAECDYRQICHQTVWGRRYWDHLTLTEAGKQSLKRCPAATSGYQLFRQQSLAEGIAASGQFALVISAVAYDLRNTALIRSGRSSGVGDFRTDWGELFRGKAQFHTWPHQEWVDFVKNHSRDRQTGQWAEYQNLRYGY